MIRGKCNKLLHEPQHAEPKNNLMVSSIFWVSSSVKGYWQAKGLTEGRKTGNEQ